MASNLLIQDGDLAILPQGTADTVSGRAKLDLDLANALLSWYDDTRPAGEFGNELLDPLERGNIDLLGPVTNEKIVSQAVTEAVERLRDYQNRNSRTEDTEMIRQIQRLTVRALNGSQTNFAFLLQVATADGDTQQYARALSFGHHNIPRSS